MQPKRLSQELPAKRAEGKSKKQVRLHVAAPSLPCHSNALFDLWHAVAQEAADDLKARGINPRTKQPYKRGGAYKKEKAESVAGSIAQLHKEQKAADAKREAGERERELREKVTALTAENARLERELQASKESVELVRKAAMLEASTRRAKRPRSRCCSGTRTGCKMAPGCPRAQFPAVSHRLDRRISNRLWDPCRAVVA